MSKLKVSSYYEVTFDNIYHVENNSIRVHYCDAQYFKILSIKILNVSMDLSKI